MSTVLKKRIDDAAHDGLLKWRAAHPKAKRWNVYDVADWLIKHEGFGLEKRLVKKEIAKLLARAQNRQRIRNKKGKLVRMYHAAKLPVKKKNGDEYQKTFWADRLTMSADFAHKSMDGRLKQTEGMCRSLFVDAEDVNENNPNLKGNPIQLIFDFEYVKHERKPQKVETVPVDQPMQMIIKATDKSMSAAKKRVAKDL